MKALLSLILIYEVVLAASNFVDKTILHRNPKTKDELAEAYRNKKGSENIHNP